MRSYTKCINQDVWSDTYHSCRSKNLHSSSMSWKNIKDIGRADIVSTTVFCQIKRKNISSIAYIFKLRNFFSQLKFSMRNINHHCTCPMPRLMFSMKKISHHCTCPMPHLKCSIQGLCYGTPKWMWTVDLMSYYLLGGNTFNIYFIDFN